MHQRTIIVADVAATMRHRYGMRDTPASRQAVAEIERRAVDQIKTTYRDHPELSVIHSDELLEGFRQKLAHETMPLVSLDDIHAQAFGKPDVHLFSHARAYDVQTGKFVLARRANHPSLRKQDRELVQNLQGKNVALMDTGIYGGSQLVRVIRRLQSRGISVRKVYVGIMRWRGYNRFAQKIKEFAEQSGHPIRLIPVLGHVGAGQNWLFDMRDMISGRNVIRGAEHLGILTYAHAPELMLPNPHRMNATNRRHAMESIQGGKIQKIAQRLLDELQSVSAVTGIHFESTGLHVRPLARGKNRRSRRVPVFRVRNEDSGRTW